MKINIITILDNVNCGTYLQAYALARHIERLGHSVEYTNYIRYSRQLKNMYRQLTKNSKSSLVYFTKIIYLWRWSCWRKSQKQIIKSYLTKRTYYSFNELKEQPPIADVYVTGSDQVWNSWHNNGLDKSFFLEYAPKNSKKIAYAASIGMDKFPTSEREDVLRMLNQYSAISVREKSAKDILHTTGIPLEKIQFVVDPTFLLSKQDWGEIVTKRIHPFSYLLIYSVESGRTEMIKSIAKFIATTKNLKIVFMSNSSSKMPGCDYYHTKVNPYLFISLFYHADFCVVSSFHGTAFSVNFQKDFVTIQANRFNSRVDNLLKLCNLEHRKYTGNENLDVYLESIDYEPVSAIIEVKKQQSKSFIMDNLNNS